MFRQSAYCRGCSKGDPAQLHWQLTGALTLAGSSHTRTGKAYIKLFANFGTRYLVLEPEERTTEPQSACHVFNISSSSNSPSRSGKLPRTAYLEAEDNLGEFSSGYEQDSCQAPGGEVFHPDALGQKTYCERPRTLRTPRGSQQFALPESRVSV